MTKQLIKLTLLFILIAPIYKANAQLNPGAVKAAKTAPVKAPAVSITTAVKSQFNPAQHGFKFVNTLATEMQIVGLNGPRINGYCSGMVYAALDYYNRGLAIPAQNFPPTTGSTLQRYIHDRQIQCWTGTLDNWSELFFNPFGWRTNEFFNWGLQGSNGGQLQNLKASIDAGKPIPLGLFKAGDGGVGPHHCVLAIGYDLGRYKGDLGQYKEDVKIFVYDPNYPNQTMTLRPNPASTNFSYAEAPHNSWMTYFADKDYNFASPPNIPTTIMPADGMVRKLLIDFCTGGDDLRGGNDNVDVHVNYTDGTTDVYACVNNRQRWIGNNMEVVEIALRRPTQCRNLKSVTLKTTFGGGISGDNWNLDMLVITAVEGNSEARVYEKWGRPLVRFDGNNHPFVATFSR